MDDRVLVLQVFAVAERRGGAEEWAEYTLAPQAFARRICLLWIKPACRGLDATRSTIAAAIAGVLRGWCPSPNAASFIVVTCRGRPVLL